ncbi:MAG TPA: hypothetical protein VN026_08335 [Bacteroidia bacterium]|jgi:hypothetical protein|nr:hypothetical protein [Bacteroidia bacterium]
MKVNYQLIRIFFVSILFCAVDISLAQQDKKINDSLSANNLVIDSSLYYRVEKIEKEVAQEKKGESNFLVVGLATMGFVLNNNISNINGVKSNTKTNSLADADRFEISPLMLWRHGKKLLIEFEPSWDGKSLGVNWGDVSYFVKPGFIVRGGYLVLPFGIYNKRLAAGWINKLGSDPVGVANYPPSSDFGVEIEGGLPLGAMKWSYDISLTNGMQLMNDGTIQNVGIVDNNRNKTITGRLSLFPFSNSSLELGISGLHGGIGDDNSIHKSATTTMYSFDLNYVKTITSILVNVKAQFNNISISNERYFSPVDSSLYTFSNQTSSFFGQLSLRPTKAPGILKNFELAGRYVTYNTPLNSTLGAITNEYDIGLNCWISWRSVLKVVYENRAVKNIVPVNLGGYQSNTNLYKRLIIQYSVQF